MINVGIIGCGRISDLHAAAYEGLETAKIVAVCDANSELAQDRARAWGVPAANVYTDYRELLARDDIDMVEILVPHHLHTVIGTAAMLAGKNVSLQKPMGITLQQADELIACARDSGVVFKVFENFIFYPPIQKAKELVDSGVIGDIVGIRIKSNPGMSPTAWEVPASANEWRANLETCGGGPLVFDDGHHKFAIAWHFLGKPVKVHAFIGSTFDGKLDAPSIVSWVHAGGAVGSLEVVYSPELLIQTRHYAQDDRVEITGTKGIIWVTQGHGRLYDQPPVQLYRDGILTSFDDIPVGWETSFIRSGRDFVEALTEGRDPQLSGESAKEILAFALAAQVSAASGREQAL